MQPITLTTHWGTFNLLPGVVDTDAKECFTRGHCHSFALAVHKLTGWPLYGLMSDYEHQRGETPNHVVVKMPDGDYLDIYGPNALKNWRKHYAYRQNPFPFTAREVMNFHKRDYREHDINAALPFAQEVLKKYTELPIQNRIPFPMGEVKRVGISRAAY